MFCCCFSASCPSPFIIDEHSFVRRTLFSRFESLSPSCDGGLNAVVRKRRRFLPSFHSAHSHDSCSFTKQQKPKQIWGETARDRGMAYEDGGEIWADGKGRSPGWWIRLHPARLPAERAKGNIRKSRKFSKFILSSCQDRSPQTRIENVLKLVMNNFSWDFLSAVGVIYTQFIWNSWTTSSCLRWRYSNRSRRIRSLANYDSFSLKLLSSFEIGSYIWQNIE